MAKRHYLTVLSVLFVLAACGSDDGAWQDDYRRHLQGEYDAMTAVDEIQACAAINSMTDQDLETLFAEQAGSGGPFEQLLADRGRTPTADDYRAAVAIAIDKARDNC